MKNGTSGKQHRQQALLRLVTRKKLATQGDLARALRGAGFPATQATISRDILELGLVKVPRDGHHVYSASPTAGGGDGPARLRRFCEDYPVDGTIAGSLVVLRSPPGTANALAIGLDIAHLAEVVGTVAGDDTVFVATHGDRDAKKLLQRLAEFGIRSEK
ncbi:MAG: arginine repressor [Chloroflexi bacterium]|nr:arginine repressor [Chloroflexota bacterium]